MLEVGWTEKIESNIKGKWHDDHFRNVDVSSVQWWLDKMIDSNLIIGQSEMRATAEQT